MNRSHDRVPAGPAGRTLAVTLVLSASLAMQAQGPPQRAPAGAAAVLRSARIVAGAAGVTVVLEADGPLPEPQTGALDAPPRIYLDLKGVRPAPVVDVGEGEGLVLRTRVALHSGNGAISTRVVLDLSRRSAYHVDASARAEGRLIVALGPSDSAPAALPSPAQPRPLPSQRPAAGTDTYVSRISSQLGRLEALRPLLVAIDRRDFVPDDRLAAARVELAEIALLLAPVKAPAAREATHGLLLRACELSVRAVRTRQDSGDSASAWNAASAAAGALMMLDGAAANLVSPTLK